MPNKKRTRREFLATSAGTVAVVTSIQPVRAAVFTADERSALAAAMDEIIPAAEGMPSATQAGGLDYLGRTIPSLRVVPTAPANGGATTGGAPSGSGVWPSRIYRTAPPSPWSARVATT